MSRESAAPWNKENFTSIRKKLDKHTTIEIQSANWDHIGSLLIDRIDITTPSSLTDRRVVDFWCKNTLIFSSEIQKLGPLTLSEIKRMLMKGVEKDGS